MNTTLQIFDYNDNPISFQMDNGTILINATEMARPFRKQPSDWMRLKQTNELISSLSAVRGIPRTGLIQVIRGGNGQQGTFFHEDVALEFARWLSPLFAVWCNDKIKELLRYGTTDLDRAHPRFIIRILDNLREGYARSIALESENRSLEAKLQEQAHKAEFYDKVHREQQSCEGKRIFRISQIAAELGMTGAELNRVLKERGIQRKCGNIWIPTDEYAGNGYTLKRTVPNGYDEDGEQRYCTFTVWTAMGRAFILSLFE